MEKALSISIRFPERWVLGADTVVVDGGKRFGKPKNREEAALMLGRLWGRSHQVVTGIALVGKGGKIQRTHVEATRVAFLRPDPRAAVKYIQSREPYDKAGAYDIQGTARLWLRELQGDYFNVMGLPVEWLLAELNRQTKFKLKG